jgi:hypothetical protein
MIDLIPARPEMAALLVPQQSQLATGQVMTRPQLEAAIESGFALACVRDAKILAIGGIAEHWPDRGVVWGLLTDSIGATMTPVHRIVRRALEATSLKRVEAHVAVEHVAAVRWIELLGFTREGTMRAFWQGHDFALYARVR